MAKRLAVEYTIGDDHETTYRANVSLIEGYSTEQDIPRIIAVRRTGRQSDEAHIHVVSTTEIK